MTDTLPAWLFNRFGDSWSAWEQLSVEDQLYWEHEAAAVRRAVSRDGFKLSRHATMLETERDT